MMSETTEVAESRARRPWKALLVSSGVGLLVLLVQFPRFTRQVVRQAFEDPTWRSVLLVPIDSVQGILHSLIGPASPNLLRRLVAIDFLALWVFFTILVLFTVRHRNKRLFGFGIGGLVAGYLGLHVVSWFALVIVNVIDFILSIVSWFTSIIATVADFVFVQGWWMLTIIGVLVVLFVFSEYILEIFAGLIGGSILVYLLYIFIPPLWHNIITLFNPALSIVRSTWESYIYPSVSLFVWLFVWALFIVISLLVVFGVLTTLGRLLVDQFRAAWSAGKGEKHLALGTFAIGSALALIILTSVAAPPIANGVNVGWQESLQIIDSVTKTHLASNLLGVFEPTRIFVATMPQPVYKFVFTYLTSVPPPVVEAIVLLFILIFATISLSWRLFPSMSDEPVKLTKYFIPKEYLRIFVRLIAPVVILFARSMYMEE